MVWSMLLLPVLLLLLGMPIIVVLLGGSIVTLVFVQHMAPVAVYTGMFSSMAKLALISVPLFIYAGAIMSQGGLSRRIIDWVMALMGGVRGALPLATVGACTVFGAVSGSGPATVAAVGALMYPALRDKGYPERFSSGLVISAGALAVVIPPSITMILYGVSAEQDIGELFIAGLLPGLLTAALIAVFIIWYASRWNIQDGGKLEMQNVVDASRKGIWALGTPFIILVGIYTGLFSPTEAAGVACFYAIVISVFVYRDIKPRDLWGSARESGYLTAQVMIIVAAAGVFSWILTISGIPQELAGVVAGLQMPGWMLLLIINVFLLLVGCVLDPASAILVLTPFLVPIVQQIGMDPVHFGVIMTVNLGIGMFTPPFGLNIFIFQAMFKTPLKDIYIGLVPFIFVNILSLMLVVYLPELSLYLPRILK